MNIDIKLDKDFSTHIQYLSRKYGTHITTLNGLEDEQINYTSFIDNFIDKQNVADASIDGNANVGHKDIVSLEHEMSKPHAKLLAFNKIYHEIKKKYGFKAANKWLEEEWVGDFYLHDAPSTTFKPYCYAYDLKRLVDEGLFFITNFNNKAPEHLTTFIDFVGEFVSWNCNRTSGAVGLPNFLIYAFYFWKHDKETGYLGITDWEKYRDQAFQEIAYRLNQPFLREGIQSAFTNINIFDRPYFEALFSGLEYPDGTFAFDYEDEIMDFQIKFMEKISEIRSINMMTFPVLTISLLKVNGKFEDEEFAKWGCKHNMKWGDSNFFISDSVTSLSNCCRLKSNIADLGYFNSIGGSALRVGSVKVNTINLARIAYEVLQSGEKDRTKKYLEILKDRTWVCLRTLDRVRDIIQRNVEKNLLPNYADGLIDIDTQYNTIGILGLYEAIEAFGQVTVDEFGNYDYTEEGLEFAKTVLRTLNEYKEEFRREENCKYMINVEAVPGERAAAILMEKDREFFPNQKYTLPLYGNQWIPLACKCSLSTKIKLSAALDEACGGGSIAHINLDAPLKDFDTAWNLLNIISDAGVTYFAFNLRISACKHNHGFYGEICPTCGEPKVTSYQRIVGFLVPEKNYSKERKAEFKLRTWMDLNSYQEM